MIDFVLGISFAGLFVRGWLRGFVKEAMGLVGLVLGIVVAFRLSPEMGRFLSGWTGLADSPARLLGGVVVFILVGVGAAVGAHYLGRMFNRPGLRVSNRFLGACLGLSWGWFLATLILSVLVVLPLPQSYVESMERSILTETLTNPALPTQNAFHTLAGDRVLESLLALQRVVGNKQIILEEGETLELEPVARSQLAVSSEAAEEIFQLLNRARIEAGLDPLAWSDGLAPVGEAHALEMYTEGYFAHESPSTGFVGDRVLAAEITLRLSGENLALAATPQMVHDGLMESPGHRANILRSEFRRVGIAVVEGPLGLIAVQVFSG